MNTQEKVDLYIERFFHRGDVIAVYPQYTTPIQNGDLPKYVKGHLTGEHRVGAYTTAPDSTIQWAVVDVDNKSGELTEQNWAFVQKYRALLSHCFQPVVERSKSTEGAYHLWHFFAEPIAAREVRKVLLPFVQVVKQQAEYPHEVEVFPKQSTVTDRKQYGNMVWLPYFGGTDAIGGGYDQQQTVFINQEQDVQDPWDTLLDCDVVGYEDLQELRRFFDLTHEEPEPRAPAPEDIGELFGGTQEGARNESGFSIANYMAKKQVSPPIIRQVLTLWNQQNDPPLTEDELQRIAVSALNRHPEEDPLELPKPYTAFVEEYVEYMAKAEGRVNIGITEIDESIRSIRPGQVMTILGFTGVGKTAVAQNIYHHYARYAKRPTIFFSQEMPGMEVFERAMQIEGGQSGQMWEREAEEKEIFRQNAVEVLQKVNNVFVYEQPHLSWSQIAEVVQMSEFDLYGDKTGLIVVDYLGLMEGQGATTYEQMTHVAMEMKNTAKTLNIPIIALSQITTDAPQTRVSLVQARDSKAISHASDFVVGLYREEEDVTQGTHIDINIELLKNRKGALSQTVRRLNKKTLRLER